MAKSAEKQQQIDVEEAFGNFLREFSEPDPKDPQKNVEKYRDLVRGVVANKSKSLVVEFKDLVAFDRSLASVITSEYDAHGEEIDAAATNLLAVESPDYASALRTLKVRFRDLPEKTPMRRLRSDVLGKLVEFKGVVVRASRVSPYVQKAVYQCMSCGTTVEITEGRRMRPPAVCPNPSCPSHQTGITRFRFLLKESVLVDRQRIRVQEEQEEVPPGQLPTYVDVELFDDVVDVARPGDRVDIVGVLEGEPSPTDPQDRILDTYFVANYIEVVDKGFEEVQITDEDVKRIKELAALPDVKERILSSIAPQIYGLGYVKEAIALSMFGSQPVYAPDGTRIRGDIHILLIGDPGVGKSQLLQFAAKLAPRGIYTSGKGSSAAGLTAAVVKDQKGEFMLEAGAMVLADGGIACLDEVDKMDENDRVAIHQAMEQQVTSIAKAGIVASLNTRASVIAAANPKLGRYMDDRTVGDNVNLPVTILSRFDLIYIIKDKPDSLTDKMLSDHILKVHMVTEQKPAIPPQLLRKYISYARRYVAPTLSEEAANALQEFFLKMRERSVSSDSPVAITPRQLEGLIRLTKAEARLRLRDMATVEDAQEAINLTKMYLSQVGIDPETGMPDIGPVTTGMTHTQQNRASLFLKTLEEMLDESKGEDVELEKFKEELAEKGMGEAEFERLYRSFLRDGEIFEPSPGKVNYVGRRKKYERRSLGREVQAKKARRYG
ncbi:MAG: minichromosome maintenance protein MCM [Thermoprotei archaeon]